MAYPNINGTLAGDNIMYLFVYADIVTNGYFGLFVVIGFFLTVLLSSLVLQFKFTGNIKFESSLLASSFSTLGFATILQQYSGIFNSIYFYVLIGLTILSFVWVALSTRK
jgi:hypothetical protein